MAWLAKSATDRKMLALFIVRSFRLHHINLSKSQSSGENFNFLLVTVVLAKVCGFKLVIG